MSVICRHCKEEIPREDNPTNRRRWCLKPECQEAKKEYAKELEKVRMKTVRKVVTKAPKKDIPVDEQWSCRNCGKLSTNRLYCPTCRERMLKMAGRVDSDWKYFACAHRTIRLY